MAGASRCDPLFGMENVRYQQGKDLLKRSLNNVNEEPLNVDRLTQRHLPQIDFGSLFDPDNEGYWLSDNVQLKDSTFNLFGEAGTIGTAKTTSSLPISNFMLPNLSVGNSALTNSIAAAATSAFATENDGYSSSAKLESAVYGSADIAKYLLSLQSQPMNGLLFDYPQSSQYHFFPNGAVKPRLQMTPDKRENQKQIERKYRWTLNTRFTELRRLLMGENQYTSNGKRVQKSGILSRAIERIKVLQRENEELQKDLAASYMLINRYLAAASQGAWFYKDGALMDMAKAIGSDKENILASMEAAGSSTRKRTTPLTNMSCSPLLSKETPSTSRTTLSSAGCFDGVVIDEHFGISMEEDEEEDEDNQDVTTTRVYAMFISVLLFCAVVIMKQLRLLTPSQSAVATMMINERRMKDLAVTTSTQQLLDQGVLNIRSRKLALKSDGHYTSVDSALEDLLPALQQPIHRQYSIDVPNDKKNYSGGDRFTQPSISSDRSFNHRQCYETLANGRRQPSYSRSFYDVLSYSSSHYYGTFANCDRKTGISALSDLGHMCGETEEDQISR